MVGSELNRTRGAQNKKKGEGGGEGETRGDWGETEGTLSLPVFALFFPCQFFARAPAIRTSGTGYFGVKILGKYFVLCFCSYLSTYYYCFFEGGREGRIIQRSESVIGPRYPGRLVLPIKNNEAF